MAFSPCSDLFFVQPVLSGHLAIPRGSCLIQVRLYFRSAMRGILGNIIAQPEAKVELGVIGVAVNLRKVTFNDLKEGRGVNNEQQWTQAGTLGNTTVQRKFH